MGADAIDLEVSFLLLTEVSVRARDSIAPLMMRVLDFGSRKCTRGLHKTDNR